MKEVILEVLGWIGLVVGLLTVAGVIGTIAIAMLLDLEFGTSLLLVGIVVISLGTATFYYLYRVWLFEKEYLLPPRFVGCPYCGMKNHRNAQFCTRCGKALPEPPPSQPEAKVGKD